MRDARKRLAGAFAEAGIAEADFDARLIVRHASGVDPAHPGAAADAPVDAVLAERIGLLASRRLAREPVARILGEREFHGLSLTLNAACLIPRDDTEAVVSAALDAIPRECEARILDLGTGPGTILLAILAERPLARGLGVDLSEQALAAARANAQALGLGARAGFATGNWTTGIGGPFDLIVSNPPYIPSADCERLDPEVRDHDPRLALDGGAKGLDAYRAILGDARRLLAPGGVVALELGIGQAHPVAAIARDAGLTIRALRSDLAGIPRALVLAVR
ncbi:MAG: peptide chain release factor N(5)-glutamine methyltransferase [Phreatobacter sp.]|nr:peptide chain release factor N(5)-glutamine methyltransferase [Phreatobacter sp.]